MSDARRGGGRTRGVGFPTFFLLHITHLPLPRPRFALARSRGCRAGVELITLYNVHEIRAVQGVYGYLREESLQRTGGARAWRSGATRNGASRSHCFQGVYGRARMAPDERVWRPGRPWNLGRIYVIVRTLNCTLRRQVSPAGRASVHGWVLRPCSTKSFTRGNIWVVEYV